MNLKCQWCGEHRDDCDCGADCPDDPMSDDIAHEDKVISDDFVAWLESRATPSVIFTVIEDGYVWAYANVNGKNHRLYRKGKVGDCLHY